MRSAVLAVLLLCCGTQVLAGTPARVQKPVSAQKAAALQNTAAAQKQLSDTRDRIKALAEEQQRLGAERNAAVKALREADGKVGGSQHALLDIEAQIAGRERKLADLQQQELELRESLTRQRAELASLVRSAYALGEHAELKLLLEQDRISDLARALAYHRYFQRDRQKRITGMQAELQSLAEVSTQIEDQRRALLAAREKKKSDLGTLARQRRDRGDMVSALDSRYRDRSARLQALGRDEKNTVQLLERLRKLMAQMPKPKPLPLPARPRPGPATGPTGARATPTIVDAAIPLGPLRLPLSGLVLAGYGGVMPDGHRSQGLLIAGSAGAEVHAVSDGRVAYADWLKGYGLLVILDHGNGWMTLYAFNDALLKNTGDSVRVGEAISTVGSSGGQGRVALYFELRRNGQPQDPRNWLKK